VLVSEDGLQCRDGLSELSLHEVFHDSPLERLWFD
jgi:hypothetical protein